MNRLLLALLLLVASTHSGAQQIPSSGLQYRFDYLEKSKKQKKAAAILRLTGGTLMLVGRIMMVDDIGDFFNPDNSDPSTPAMVFFLVGSAATIISIPLRKSYKENEEKAVGISFQHKPFFRPIHQSFTSNILPSITLKLPL